MPRKKHIERDWPIQKICSLLVLFPRLVLTVSLLTSTAAKNAVSYEELYKKKVYSQNACRETNTSIAQSNVYSTSRVWSDSCSATQCCATPQLLYSQHCDRLCCALYPEYLGVPSNFCHICLPRLIGCCQRVSAGHYSAVTALGGSEWLHALLAVLHEIPHYAGLCGGGGGVLYCDLFASFPQYMQSYRCCISRVVFLYRVLCPLGQHSREIAATRIHVPVVGVASRWAGVATLGRTGYG